MFVEEQSVELLRDVITCNASISACEKGEQWQQALDLFVAEQSVKLLPDVIACIAREKGAMAAGRIRHSFHWAARRVSFEERWSLKCLCAIVPLCLAPDKTMIAKQVPGHLFELHVKSGRHSSASVLL